MPQAEPRSEEAIRADLATRSDSCGAVIECEHGLNIRATREAGERLIRDVEPLLARVSELQTERDEVFGKGLEQVKRRAEQAEVERDWARAAADQDHEALYQMFLAKNELLADVRAVEALIQAHPLEVPTSTLRFALAAVPSQPEATT